VDVEHVTAGWDASALSVMGRLLGTGCLSVASAGGCLTGSKVTVPRQRRGGSGTLRTNASGRLASRRARLGISGRPQRRMR
jgi:hypothetical protein